MTQEQQRPITPPNELVASLRNSAPHSIRDAGVTREHWLINHAFAAGADHELEALLVWLRVKGFDNLASDLLAARRPKPPTRKEALEALERMQDLYPHMGNARTIRFALEALPE